MTDWTDKLEVKGEKYTFFSLPRAETAGLKDTSKLPYCLRIMLENVLRHDDGSPESKAEVDAFSSWTERAGNQKEVNFFPTRIMIHDVSGIPLIADLAAMRERIVSLGGEMESVHPVRPVDFIMDHSVIVDVAGKKGALKENMEAEYSRNRERYRVAKWAQNTFRNMRVVPPGNGICHQINLEKLGKVVWRDKHDNYGLIAYPDSLVACDSHTPMINALSVLGWGVGAIEGLSAMLGEPISMIIPDVVGVRLVGKMSEATTTTDLVLALTHVLREVGVVQKFVEFIGPGVSTLSLPERATLSNMAPEYGASVGFFPTDDETLKYLNITGRNDQVAIVEAYARAQGLWRDDGFDRAYSKVVEFNLDKVEPCLAGPNLPQIHVPLSKVHVSISKALSKTPLGDTVSGEGSLKNGDIAIAAITSCTNTSNPSVMLAAGLLAKKARERGLFAKPWVKTSLSPGSRAVGKYLSQAGLISPLEELGFHITGYGCMTCCGGSGDLAEHISSQIALKNLQVTAILSGNRNFQGRIHPNVDFAYLGAPPLVVAYALLGTMRRDITTTALGVAHDGAPVYLRDIWPKSEEIEEMIGRYVTKNIFETHGSEQTDETKLWDQIDAGDEGAFHWDNTSNYIVRPPFLENPIGRLPITGIKDAAILAIFADNLTTDHISPGTQILENSLAGQYLIAKGENPSELSSFLQRRVNHEVMIRGTFNNEHIQNEMIPERKGGWTIHQPSGEIMTIFDAHLRYSNQKRPLVVIAGKHYGTGSSRDWAAKGPYLLGVRAIIAESFERIHRCNLIGMGVLPLQFLDGQTSNILGLEGVETVDILEPKSGIGLSQIVTAQFTKSDSTCIEIKLLARLDTARELAWFESGGVMSHVLKRFTDQKENFK